MKIEGDTITFTEIKGASVANTNKKHKRRLGRAANYSLKEKVSDIHGTTQQMRDSFMLHQSDLSDYTIPRLGNKKLSDFSKVNVIWELYDVSSKTNKVTKMESFDLSTPEAVKLAIYDINN